MRYTLDPGGPPVFTSGQELLASDKPIEAVKLPPLHSKKPLYLTAKLGDGADTSFTFVLDESEPGAGYDLLYADSSHTRDLTDVKPYRLTRWRWWTPTATACSTICPEASSGTTLAMCCSWT